MRSALSFSPHRADIFFGSPFNADTIETSLIALYSLSAVAFLDDSLGLAALNGNDDEKENRYRIRHRKSKRNTGSIFSVNGADPSVNGPIAEFAILAQPYDGLKSQAPLKHTTREMSRSRLWCILLIIVQYFVDTETYVIMRRSSVTAMKSLLASSRPSTGSAFLKRGQYTKVARWHSSSAGFRCSNSDIIGREPSVEKAYNDDDYNDVVDDEEDEDEDDEDGGVVDPAIQDISLRLKVRQHVNPLSSKYLVPVVLQKKWETEAFAEPYSNPLIIDIGIVSIVSIVSIVWTGPSTDEHAKWPHYRSCGGEVISTHKGA